MQSMGLSRVFSSTTIQKHQFFSAQPSLWSNSHSQLGQHIKRRFPQKGDQVANRPRVGCWTVKRITSKVKKTPVVDVFTYIFHFILTATFCDQHEEEKTGLQRSTVFKVTEISFDQFMIWIQTTSTPKPIIFPKFNKARNVKFHVGDSYFLLEFSFLGSRKKNYKYLPDYLKVWVNTICLINVIYYLNDLCSYKINIYI